MKQVVQAVLWQQVVQTILGFLWLEDDEAILQREVYRDHLGAMRRLAPWVVDGTLVLLGKKTGESLLRDHGEAMVRWVYWWGIPCAQMFFALCVFSLDL